MGYYYIIRIAAEMRGCVSDLQLIAAYKHMNKISKYPVQFGCVERSSSGYPQENIKEILLSFTDQFPEIIFTFYIHSFDYQHMEIIKIRNRTIINTHEISFEDDLDDISILKEHGIIIIDEDAKNYDGVIYDEIYEPCNMKIKNEISAVFINIEEQYIQKEISKFIIDQHITARK
jgi:hypothetical protein